MLQQTLDGFPVRCCVSRRMHQTRCGVHSCVQAAAAARVAGGPDIMESAAIGDGALVLCHVIADADKIEAQDKW
jgi:hypothetical protein